MAVEDKRCVILELELADKERILKYLGEHVYSYNWILREDNEKVRLCVWWREYDYKVFSVTPLRSFLKRLKNKTHYDKIVISNMMNTYDAVQTLCEWESGSIKEYYLEESLTTHLQDILSINSINHRSGVTNNRKITICKRIMKDISAQDISTQLTLLQNIADVVVPLVKEQLVRPTLPEEEELPRPTLTVPYPVPEPHHPVLETHLSRIQAFKDEIQSLNEEIYRLNEEIQTLKPELPELPELPFEQSLPVDDDY